ncbi:hypothetical protein NDU88_005280 [Pleurodeles waltl]|uniref:Uncharacterized protein n=1 Tax=Pleurodeles waltl TaxID=8319 RepID=A0AAV7TA60_PLEWA|nr:hypothetical protein NDU88_005280 [Pleurodeles waltl]
MAVGPASLSQTHCLVDGLPGRPWFLMGPPCSPDARRGVYPDLLHQATRSQAPECAVPCPRLVARPGTAHCRASACPSLLPCACCLLFL